MTLCDFEKWLEQYLNFEKKPQKNIFWLDTMKFLCNEFGNPQNAIPCFHVAGSKGKGSVSMMIACILEEHGKKTGIYSSPHILNFAERVSLPNKFFDDEIYSKSAEELVNKIENLNFPEHLKERPITWFELTTLFAMLCFKNAACDYSVYEVGLGGRLDSTNIVNPLVSCISRIELEHTNFLGNTLELIAGEKGGIIKENVPVIISSQKENVKNVFRKIANEKNARLSFVDEECEIKTELKNQNQYVEISSKIFSRTIKTNLKMLGKFQAENAALASFAVKKAIPKITEDEIERGLSKAFLPARFEIIENLPDFKNLSTLVLDGAHTLNSVNFTMETFNALFPKSQNTRHLLFACAADKDAEDIVCAFKNQFDKIIITKPGFIKQSDLPRLEEALKNAGIEFSCIPDFNEAIAKSFKEADLNKATLLVTGSFYLISEVKKYVQHVL